MKTLLHCLLLSCVFALPAFGDDRSGTKTVRAGDGLKIAYESHGNGETALVFLHGWCGDRQYWKNQIDNLASDYRVITLDMPGHGESGKDRKEWSAKALADDVEKVIDELGLKRVILVGHSMGGPLSLMVAKDMPGKVVGVIGVDTLQNAESKMPEDFAKKFLAGLKSDFQGTLKGAFGDLFHEKTDPEIKKWVIDRAISQDPKIAVGIMSDFVTLDLKPLFKDAKIPIRCINAAGGFKFHRPTDIELNKKLADYDAVMMENVGHYPMLEKPTEFNEKLQKTLKEFAIKK